MTDGNKEVHVNHCKENTAKANVGQKGSAVFSKPFKYYELFHLEDAYNRVDVGIMENKMMS